MNRSDTLGPQMLAIVALHDLTSVSFTAHKVAEGSLCSLFECSMHHEKLADRLHGVTFGYGDTLQIAYDDAVSILEAARAPALEQAA